MIRIAILNVQNERRCLSGAAYPCCMLCSCHTALADVQVWPRTSLSECKKEYGPLGIGAEDGCCSAPPSEASVLYLRRLQSDASLEAESYSLLL